MVSYIIEIQRSGHKISVSLFLSLGLPLRRSQRCENLFCYNLLRRYKIAIFANREDSCTSDGLKEDGSHSQYSAESINITNISTSKSHVIKSKLCIEHKALVSFEHYLEYRICHERLPLPTVCLQIFLACRRRSPRSLSCENGAQGLLFTSLFAMIAARFAVADLDMV